MSDLNELNEILFDSIRKVKAGKMDTKQAKSVFELSTSIINTGKLQLDAYKLANKAGFPELMGLPKAEAGPAVEGNLSSVRPIATKNPVSVSVPLPKDQDKKAFLTPEEKQELAKKDRHAAMTMYAKEIGFRNMPEAIAAHTSRQFTKDFEAWLEEN